MEHMQYMRRCLQLAGMGMSHVAPDPMVGAVVVCDGTVVGEGYHRRFGEPHAEPNAINSVADKSLLSRSTLYVSLEPCSHYGKTPPCADLIVACGIPRVIVGMVDPNPQVAGRGVRKLQDAGIEVTVGVMENECRELNKHFITFHEQHRPYVFLKWAQTADGFIDRLRNDAHTPPLSISNELTRLLTHRERAAHQAILVGGGTATLDNPSLTLRHWHGRTPTRFIIDPVGCVHEGMRLCDSTAQTVIYTTEAHKRHHKPNVECVTTDFDRPGTLRRILQDMYERGINSLMVEGGGYTLEEFIGNNLWDEARIELAPLRIGQGKPAPRLPGTPVSIQNYQGHICYRYRNTASMPPGEQFHPTSPRTQ